jgi:hypothetical protein
MAGYDDETVNADRRGIEPPVPRIDAGRLWAGGAASAVVAALIALVGVLVIRAVFKVAFSGSAEAGAFGDSAPRCSAPWPPWPRSRPPGSPTCWC